MAPLISVIIPAYNRKHLLLEALASVSAQTFDDMETIVADDGSTDGTFEAVRREFPGVRYVRSAHTGFPGRVRNTGAAEASGKYLAFLDSDDLWVPEKIELQMRVFEAHPETALCHTRELWLRNGKEVSQAGQIHKREGIIFSDSLRKCIIGPSTVVMEKTLFDMYGGFREDLEIAEDYELWLRITCSNPVAYSDSALTVKRAGIWDQLSERYGHIEYYRIQALKALVDRTFFPDGEQRLAERELSRKCSIYAAGCRKRGREEEALLYEALALRYVSEAKRADPISSGRGEP